MSANLHRKGGMKMDDYYNLIRRSIDYYLSKTSTVYTLVFSVIAIIISAFALVLSVYTFFKRREEGIYNYLSNLWNEILDACIQQTEFLDINITENYETKMNLPNRFKYEAFCFKSWGLVKDIIERGFQKKIQFEPIIHWVTAYHVRWLDCNPTFFSAIKFWETVNAVKKKLKEEPHIIFRYKPLPRKNNEIDWDTICENYFEYILSPFAPEMEGANASGPKRNLLLQELLSIPKDDIVRMEIADFGCGPGNLIPYLPRYVTKLNGIDKSKRALEIAGEVAKKYNIEFVPHHTDFLKLNLGQIFDIIISVNSITPSTRDDVVLMLRKIRDHLKPNGSLMAILPSFDTTIYLKSLWKERYVKEYKCTEHADRIIKSIDINKKVNESACCYADDGCISQCYHTQETIKKELENAGLRLTSKPEKIYYPWELTKKFDYGYFPKAKEEIWDWYVTAERAAD
jgi:2-polyprenyl-3-methyl-5-hydroxy-6-metoxy-1,4-benzoquinol methylase